MNPPRQDARQRLTQFLGVPADLLDRVRWLFFLFLILGVGLAFPGLGSVDVPVWPNQLTAAIALATLVTWALWLYRTEGVAWTADVVPIAVLIVVGLGLGNPGLVASQGLAVLYFRSLYGSRLRVFLNASAYVMVHGLAVLRAQGPAELLTLGNLSVLIGFLVTAALIHALSEVLTQYQARAVRESLLTEAGAALLAADGHAAVLDVAQQSVLELAGGRAEVAALELRQGRLRLAGTGGSRKHPVPDVEVDDLPPDARRAVRSTTPVALEADRGRRLLVAAGLPPDPPGVIVLSVGRGGGRHVIIAATPESPTPSLMDAFGRLSVDVSLALDRAGLTSELQRRESLFRGVVESSSDVVAILSPLGEIRFVNPSVRAFGYEPEEVVGLRFTDLIHPDDRQRVVREFARQVAGKGPREIVEFRLAHAGGTWRHVEVSANRVRDSRDGTVVVNVRDVTARRELEAEMKFQAFHDPLTRLANRALLMDRMEQAVARASRTGRPTAVALLDLDDFKAVNDNLGHAAGDALLVELADRLRSHLRTSDTVARLGGDEFALLLENIRDAGEAIDVVERAMEVVRRPVTLEEQLVAVRGSVGVALYDARAADPHDLMRNADVAMYAAKAGGKGRVEVFDPTMHVAALERLELRADLEVAIQNGELRLHYQPIIDLESRRVGHLEALIRWEHPRRGMVSPIEFIPLAEESRLIVPIGAWILQEACAAAMRWRRELPGLMPGVSVNLSVVQLQHDDLVDEVAGALAASALPPGSLTLEVTETALMKDTDLAVERLEALADLGVRIAIDDFGTGYSSFGYLNRFPIHVLKVDRTFVDRILDGPEDAALAQAIIRLAQTLGLSSIAEGIETEDQVPLLRSWGCGQGQGYLFSPPLPDELVVKWAQAFEGSHGGGTPDSDAPGATEPVRG